MIFFPSENYMAIRQQNGLIRHTFVLFIIHLSLLSFLHYKALHGWCQGLNKTSSTYVEEKHTCFHITECTISKVIFKTRIQKVSILFIFKAMISTNLSQQSKPLLRQRPSQGGSPAPHWAVLLPTHQLMVSTADWWTSPVLFLLLSVVVLSPGHILVIFNMGWNPLRS